MIHDNSAQQIQIILSWLCEPKFWILFNRRKNNNNIWTGELTRAKNITEIENISISKDENNCGNEDLSDFTMGESDKTSVIGQL